MATTCDTCGHKTNEVKSGAGIEPNGVRIEVDVRNKEDLTRDVLKVIPVFIFSTGFLLVYFCSLRLVN